MGRNVFPPCKVRSRNLFLHFSFSRLVGFGVAEDFQREVAVAARVLVQILLMIFFRLEEVLKREEFYGKLLSALFLQRVVNRLYDA